MPTDSVDVKELLEIQEKSFRAAVQLLVDKQMQESKLLRQEISDLRMSLTYSQREIDDLKVKCNKLEKDNVRNQANFEDTHAAIVDVEDQSDYLENQSRRNNLKISGIPEKENGFETWEETEQLVKEAIKDKLKITTDIQIERAHRIGQRGGGRRAEGRGRRQMFSNNRKENEPRTIVAKCLSWKHKSEVIQAARKLKPDGHLLPTNVLVSLYYSLFASFLQYGIIVWGLACDTHTKPIYLLQKKVVRAIAFKNYTSPSTPIFSELKILKLYDLSNLKLLTFVYESVNLISPIFFHNFFETLPSVHQYDTRQARRGDIL